METNVRETSEGAPGRSAAAAAEKKKNLSEFGQRVFESYFEGQENNIFVKHHLDSYNDFVQKHIAEIFGSLSVIEANTHPHHPENGNSVRVTLGGKQGSRVFIGKPVTHDHAGSVRYLMPNEARVRKMNYYATLHADMEVVAEYRQGPFYDQVIAIADTQKSSSSSSPPSSPAEAEPEEVRLPPSPDYPDGRICWVRVDRDKKTGGAKQRIVQCMHSFSNLFLGRIPLMVQSKLCALGGLHRDLRVEMGERSDDCGGYFIHQGNEIVEISTISEPPHHPRVFLFKDPSSWSHTVRIDSGPSDLSMNYPVSRISMEIRRSKFTGAFYFALPWWSFVAENGGDGGAARIDKMDDQSDNDSDYDTESENESDKEEEEEEEDDDREEHHLFIPLFIGLRALGAGTSDKELIQLCVGDEDPSNTTILAEKLRASVCESGRIFTQMEAIRYIADLVDRRKFNQANVATNADCLAKSCTPLAEIVKRLDECVLPHMGKGVSSRGGKLYFLGRMVKQLLRVVSGLDEIETQRADLRIYGAGYSLGNALLKALKSFHQDYRQELEKWISRDMPETYASILEYVPEVCHSTVRSCTEYTESAFLEWAEKCTEPLDRTTSYATFTQLRQIPGAPLVYGFFDILAERRERTAGSRREMTTMCQITSSFSTTEKLAETFVEWVNSQEPAATWISWTWKQEYRGTAQERLSPRSCVLYFDGLFLGIIRFPYAWKFVHFLRDARRRRRQSGFFSAFPTSLRISISFNLEKNEIHIHSDPGRIVRPAFYRLAPFVGGGIRNDHDEIPPAEVWSYDRLLSKNKRYIEYDVLEYLDISEQQGVVFVPGDATSSAGVEAAAMTAPSWRTHLDIHPCSLLGFQSTTVIPFLSHFPLKPHSFDQTLENMRNSCANIYYTQSPLIQPFLGELWLKNYKKELLGGQNLVVAVASVGGNDAILVNQAALDRGLFATWTQKQGIRCAKEGDVLLSRHGLKSVIARAVDPADWFFARDGTAPDIILHPHTLFTDESSSFLVSQILEILFGGAASVAGKEICQSHNPLAPVDIVSSVRDALTSFGLHDAGHRVFYRGDTGEPLSANIFSGVLFLGLSLDTTAGSRRETEIDRSSRLAQDFFTHEPIPANTDDQGVAVRVQEEDTFAMIGHGLASQLQNMFCGKNNCDSYKNLVICSTTGLPGIYHRQKEQFYSPMAEIDCPPFRPHISDTADPVAEDMDMVSIHGREYSRITVPYSWKLLIQELMALGIGTRIITDQSLSSVPSMHMSTNALQLARAHTLGEWMHRQKEWETKRKSMGTFGIPVQPSLRMILPEGTPPKIKLSVVSPENAVSDIVNPNGSEEIIKKIRAAANDAIATASAMPKNTVHTPGTPAITAMTWDDAILAKPPPVSQSSPRLSSETLSPPTPAITPVPGVLRHSDIFKKSPSPAANPVQQPALQHGGTFPSDSLRSSPGLPPPMGSTVQAAAAAAPAPNVNLMVVYAGENAGKHPAALSSGRDLNPVDTNAAANLLLRKSSGGGAASGATTGLSAAETNANGNTALENEKLSSSAKPAAGPIKIVKKG